MLVTFWGMTNRQGVDMKHCNKCKQTKPIDEFGNHKKSKDGKRHLCKKCESVYRKQYRLKNPQKPKYRKLTEEQRLRKIETSILWNKKNKAKRTLAMAKRRALKKNNGVYLITVKEIKKLQSLLCLYCGQTGGEIDHVIPLTRGGRDSIGNLVPACRSCNASKNSRTITEWKMAKRKAARQPTI